MKGFRLKADPWSLCPLVKKTVDQPATEVMEIMEPTPAHAKPLDTRGPWLREALGYEMPLDTRDPLIREAPGYERPLVTRGPWLREATGYERPLDTRSPWI